VGRGSEEESGQCDAVMSAFYVCCKCGSKPESTPLFDISWYHVDHGGVVQHFCSRRCLVEFIAPELNKAVAVRQWVPTPEEERRMSEEST
jgi:hypothetical protein